MKNIFAVSMALLASSTASAGLVTSGIDNAFLSVNNDFGSALVQQGNILETTAGSFDVTFTALFKEAANINFFIPGIDVLSTANIGDSFTSRFDGPGALDFLFVSSGGASVRNVDNTAQFLSGAGGDFATVALEDGAFLLGFNDAPIDPSAPGYIDADYDDLVIRVEAVAVHEPGMLALMGLGLMGVGLTRIRKNK